MTGITGFTKGSAALSVLPDTPPGELWRYGGGGPFQVAPHLAAFFSAIWVEGQDNIDFTNGSDLIFLDDFSNIRSDNAIPLSRNETGKSSITVKGTVVGGFVSLGAKLTDGSPHPHAVTVTARVPPYHFRILSFGPPRAHVKRRDLDIKTPVAAEDVAAVKEIIRRGPQRAAGDLDRSASVRGIEVASMVEYCDTLHIEREELTGNTKHT